MPARRGSLQPGLAKSSFVEPSLAAAMVEQAASLHQAGRLDEAQALYVTLADAPAAQRRIVLQLLVLLERQRGRWSDALSALDQLFAMGEPSAELLLARGELLVGLSRLDEALCSFDRALAIQPDLLAALTGRADVLDALGRPHDALASYAAALKLKPDLAVALNNQGLVLQRLARLDEALHSYDRALAADPGFAVAWNNRSAALRRLNRLEAALASAERALVLRPDYPEAFNSRAAALIALDRFGEAVTVCDEGFRLCPDFVPMLNTKGFSLAALAQFDDALTCYGRALGLDPDYAEAEFNSALSLLRLGRFEAGWRAFEARWRRPGHPGPTFPDQILWLGQSEVAGLTVLLHCEQGLGDTLQFCRYARHVAERGARVVLQVQPGLKRLLNNLDGVDELIGSDEPVTPFDLHTPLMSLPLALGLYVPEPALSPYLQADPLQRREWEDQLPRPGLRVGLAWAGNPAHGNDRNRSIPLDALAPVLACDVQFVTLQQTLRPSEIVILTDYSNIVRCDEGLSDFNDTAALASTCDLIICVDTAVAHLAGALGIPLWLLLPYDCDWRWTGANADSTWYASVRLWRQTRNGDWSGVIEGVAQTLPHLCHSHQHPDGSV